MNDEPPVPRFFVEGKSGPLRYMEDPDAVPDQSSVAGAVYPSSITPSVQSIPESAWNSSQHDDPVFSTSATVPQLRRRQHMRIQRVQSAPTMMEHEVGLALRSISDEFNDSYNQVHADRTRRASHPGTNNNHRPRGFIDGLRRQFSRRSWTSSQGGDSGSASGLEVGHHPVTQPGSSRLSQRASIQSVLEEDEEQQQQQQQQQ